MKKGLTIVSFFLLSYVFAYGQKPYYYDIVKKHLLTVRKNLYYPELVSRDDVLSSASFLSAFTGIDSRTDGNYRGPNLPDERDLKGWIEWIELNYKFGYWDVNRLKYLSLNFSTSLVFQTQ